MLLLFMYERTEIKIYPKFWKLSKMNFSYKNVLTKAH